MVTKKNSEKETSNTINWVQIATLIISIFGIIIWLFWIYLTGVITKTNEVETRLYQQKYEVYKWFTTEIHKLINFPWENLTLRTVDRYKRNIQNLEDFILEKWPWIRILWWDIVNKYFNCLSNNIDWFKNEILGNIKKIDEINNEVIWRNFQEEIILSLWFLENSMRKELGREALPDLHYYWWWSMKNIYEKFNKKCELSWNHIQSSNYFSWYLFNLK